jgi:hypothetical protein
MDLILQGCHSERVVDSGEVWREADHSLGAPGVGAAIDCYDFSGAELQRLPMSDRY